MLKYFIYIINTYFFYIEFDMLILYSSIGIIKIRNKLLKYFFIKKNIFFSLFTHYNILSFVKLVFHTISYGYTSRFTLVGIGYRQFYSNSIIVYKLWYNHLIFKTLPLDLITFKKNKKRKYFSVFSLNKNKLNRIINIWSSYRIMNVYTKKGFFKKSNVYYYKPIIKKLI